MPPMDIAGLFGAGGDPEEGIVAGGVVPVDEEPLPGDEEG